ncbi:four-helix bundle copper-binding protein [Cnuella takakiae]|nr:four-helix bundle copper-binding protein [Cnuella takakiae]
MSLGSAYAKDFSALCARVCEACATECGKHQMLHCQQCAAACHKCAEACWEMAR